MFVIVVRTILVVGQNDRWQLLPAILFWWTVHKNEIQKKIQIKENSKQIQKIQSIYICIYVYMYALCAL